MNVQDIDLAAWIGRSETLHDSVGATPVAALTATLDHPAAAATPGTALPPLWHWLYFLLMRPQVAAPCRCRHVGSANQLPWIP